jgi:hypothetical protein
LPEFKAGSEFKPEEYGLYFEDLNLLPNAVIGQEAPFLAGKKIKNGKSGYTPQIPVSNLFWWAVKESNLQPTD